MDFIKQLEDKGKALLETLRQELGGIRTNRPSPKLFEDMKVSYAESVLSIKQLATIGVNPPREVVITPWDKAAIPAIAKAIEEGGGGFSPVVDGNVVRVNLPPLTAERREELVRLVKTTTEKVRIRVRNERDVTNKIIERSFQEKALTEDARFKLKKQVQEAIDKINKDIDALVEKKVKEVQE